LREAAARLRGHQTGRVLLGAAVWSVGVAVGVVALWLLVDRFAPLPAWLRAVGTVLAVGLPIVVFARALFLRLPALRSLEEAARRTERESLELRERLVPALQVLDTRDDVRTGYSTALVDALVDDTVQTAGRVRPADLPYNESLRRGAVVATVGAAAALVCGLVLGPARTGTGLVRLAGAFGELGPRPPAHFTVEPGDVSVPRGKDVTLAARVDHARLSAGGAEAVLQWRAQGEAPWSELRLSGDVLPPSTDASGHEVPAARFEHRFAGVRDSFHYRFVHADQVSEEHEVRAVPHPSLTIDEVRYTYPTYTGLPDRSVRDGSGDLAAVKGTTAEVVVRCTNEPRTARLVLGSGAEQALEPDADGRLRGTVSIVAEDTYTLHVEDTLGLVNPNPLSYRVRALADEAPFIRLLEPGEDRDLDESLRQTLRFSAVDDFGLGPVELVWEVSRREGESVRRTVFAPEGTVTEANESVEWDLADLDLLPGDTVIYHLEVADNNVLDGPSRARTRSYALRFPTLGEIYAEMDEDQDASIEDLRDVADEAKRVEEQVEKISREMLKQGESSWENKKEMERALQSQEKIADALRETQAEIEANLDKLADSEFATLEAVQKMERIRELVDELATDEMKETLEKLRRAMEQANPHRMQDDLAEFKMSQEEMMRSLDRVIENLKQFRLEERLKAAVREMEELAARQERVNDALKPDETNRGAEERADRAAEERTADESAPESGDEAKSDEVAQGDEETQADDGDRAGENAESEDETHGAEGDEKLAESDETGAEEASPEGKESLENLAREEEALAEEARRLEKELRELAEMTKELRDSRDQQTMGDVADRMDSGDIPETMGDMSQDMQQGDTPGAREKGEKALTELRKTLTSLQQGQQQMASRMMQINQAALNRAVRDLLSVSGDQEQLAGDLAEIPRNTSSATRTFADEQYLLIHGGERVNDMLEEVSKDTPLMDSAVGERLREGLRVMKEAAFGLENGAVHMAREDGDRAVEDLNAVVIALLETTANMGSCASGMPMSSFMQQLRELSGDQQKLNDALQQLMKDGSRGQRLQAKLDDMAGEQQRIREQLQQLLEETGSGKDLLGRLDAVTEALEKVEKKLREGRLDDETLREQDWALTRLLDSQRSMRERDFGRERKSRTGEELADRLPPGALPEGTEEERRDLREDLLRALDRRYPPKYEDLIRRYFRSLSEEEGVPDLP
jgi:hypothetical protein